MQSVKTGYAALLIVGGLALGPAWAQTAPPQGVLTLSASATTEVTQDVLSVTFSVMRDGADAAGVQRALKHALDAALTEARKVARPQQVEVQTGNFSLFPRYAPRGGSINGWQGSAEMTVQGRDLATIAQLTGSIQSMSIARVGYTLSREVREKVEADVTAQAIARFRAKAGDLAKQFGYGSASIREVNVASDESGGMPVPMMRMKAAGMASDEALPVEPGKGTVSATVNGSVQMN
jgi:predicted secreted protein